MINLYIGIYIVYTVHSIYIYTRMHILLFLQVDVLYNRIWLRGIDILVYM